VACARSRCPLHPVCGQHGLDIVTPSCLVPLRVERKEMFEGFAGLFARLLARQRGRIPDGANRPLSRHGAVTLQSPMQMNWAWAD
jgi:hypothetical protein